MDDALIEVTKHEGGIHIAKVVRAKDHADGDTFGFRLDRVGLGEDADGDPITAPIMWTRLPRPGRRAAT